jgi:ubiquinone/menaquinone biosynthesis C-methylase UbiE
MTLRFQQEYYEQDHFWGNEPSPKNLARINEIISLIPNCVNSVLDVGCGDGCIINRLHNAGYESYGVDISSKALSYVKCRKKRMSCDNLQFKDNSFDLIISSEIIEHLEDTVFMETLKEMERVTKKYIIISVPYDEFLRSRMTRCLFCKKEHHIYNHLRSFSDKDLGNLFKNFRIVDKRYTGKIKVSYWFEKILRYNLGNFYINKKTALCPYCGKKNSLKRKYNLFSLMAAASVRIIPRREKPHWACVLYQKID